MGQERSEEAAAVYREAIRLCAAVLGPREAATLQCRLERALALKRLQRLDEAESETLKVLGAAREEAQPGLIAEARLQLAQIKRDRGRLEEARAEVAELMDLPHIRGSEFQYDAMDIHAHANGFLGHHQAAASEFEALAEAITDAHGSQDLRVLKARSDRVQVLTYLGRYEEAEQEGRALIDIATSNRPRLVPLELAARNALVLALAARGHGPEAEAEARTAIKQATAAEGTDADILLVLQLGLARSLNAQSRFDEALSILKPALESFPRVEQHLAAALHLVSGTSLLGLGRGATEQARLAVDICQKKLGSRHHRALEADTLHGRALAAQGRVAEATEQLTATTAAWREYFGDNHPNTRTAQVALDALIAQ
ncbi:hypothetical protein GCM10010441_40080 [Kitasatospora paracochleata]|uniref:Tetratricopeptide (TPR) repeat protein n=1 Tax=Kitasatospora paracochleata TaxID=58354 RepID=A0ABT1IVV6_9ACTN|nr:tetratricopeptide repeat protein [Kitasatospora paracochleata]MCP2309273.1 tetratricopeptide (TPR) repeat protein [Kitasatospora paracochleata]